MPGFPRERRIRRTAEIRAIVGGGRSAEGPNLRVHVGAEQESAPGARAAVVVPRYGRTAVERNRLKRRLRELVRLHMLHEPRLGGGAFVIRARAGAYGRTFAELRAELLRISERLAKRVEGGGR